EFPPGPSPLDPPSPPSQPPPPIPEPPAVPEPSTYVMMAAGLAVMGWLGRKRRLK
ncbi:MAG: PEP-CTERM sorting domain-containing protein, partial [Acidobacteria bacterium]|nr:PEP-CTERM sorting domain-containing protein [Acidobacteriota bacterium]